MTPKIPLLLSMLLLGHAAQDPPAKRVEPLFDESADGSAQITAALARAKKENRRVLVEWGANWCVWCRTLHSLCRNDEGIRKELQYEYDVVLLDVGRFDKHGDLLKKYEVDLAQTGIPFLTILDSAGAVLANQETGSLELEDKAAKAHDPKKVLELLERHRATPLPAEDVLAAGLREAKLAEKLVFLHFGTPWCGWCRKLEAWMETEEVSAILSGEFVGVKIDLDRTLGGNEVRARLGGVAEAGLPWFVILDPSGLVVARGDMPEGGAIGFPYEAAEIQAFGAMLAKGAARLAPEEISVLERSLTAIREGDERARADSPPEKKSE
ncbi:MAG: thioredoxin family protein [Planctomycetota bacterium]